MTATDKLDGQLKVIWEHSRLKREHKKEEAKCQAVHREKEGAAESEAGPAVLSEIARPADPEPDRPGDGTATSSDAAPTQPYATRANVAKGTQEDDLAGNAPADLLAEGHEADLAAAIREIVTVEGPIRDDVLARRIAKLCGLYKSGARIREKVLMAARREFKSAKEEVGVFFWPSGSQPGQWETFRRSMGDGLRPADEISLAELAALARELGPALGPEDDAAAAMAKAMGLQRLRSATRARLERAWQLIFRG